MSASALIVTIAASTGINAQGSPAQELAVMSQLEALGSKCRWISPLQQQVIRLTKLERLAMITSVDGATAAGAATSGAAAAAASVAEECTGAAVDGPNGLKARVAGLANQLTAMWLVRADAAGAAAKLTPYAAQMTILEPYKAAIDSGMTKLTSANAAAVATMKAQAAGEAALVLGLVCPDRQTVRWPEGRRPCPAIPEADRRYLPFARAWLEGAEAFAAVYAEFAGFNVMPPSGPVDPVKGKEYEAARDCAAVAAAASLNMDDAAVRAITTGLQPPKEVADFKQLAYQLEINALAMARAAGIPIQAAEKAIKSRAVGVSLQDEKAIKREAIACGARYQIK